MGAMEGEITAVTLWLKVDGLGVLVQMDFLCNE